MSKGYSVNNIRRSKHFHVHTMTDPAAGEIICIDCGVVISDRARESLPRWRTSTNNNLVSNGRGGRPMSLAMHDQGLLSLFLVTISTPMILKNCLSSLRKTVHKMYLL